MPITVQAEGVRLAVRLTPKAAKNHFGQVIKTADDGKRQIKAYVTTVPEDGKANKTLLKMLAKALHLPASKISVASGATNRNKQLLIEGDGQELRVKLEKWIKDVTP